VFFEELRYMLTLVKDGSDLLVYRAGYPNPLDVRPGFFREGEQEPVVYSAGYDRVLDVNARRIVEVVVVEGEVLPSSRLFKIVLEGRTGKILVSHVT